MEGKTLARIAAVVFAGVAITASVIEMNRKDDIPPVPAARDIRPAATDPLREAQRRCQRLGEAAASDAQCLAVWAETRDRFLGLDRSPRPDAPQSAPPLTANDDLVTKQTAPAEPGVAGER